MRRLARFLFSLSFLCPNCKHPTRTGHWVRSWLYADGFWECDELRRRRT